MQIAHFRSQIIPLRNVLLFKYLHMKEPTPKSGITDLKWAQQTTKVKRSKTHTLLTIPSKYMSLYVTLCLKQFVEGKPRETKGKRGEDILEGQPRSDRHRSDHSAERGKMLSVYDNRAPKSVKSNRLMTKWREEMKNQNLKRIQYGGQYISTWNCNSKPRLGIE